jgi:hypothetical protein
MKSNAPKQTIDLAGLKISLKTYGDLSFFFNIADGFETLSDVAERALSEWLAQQGAALRMSQIDMQLMAHDTEDDATPMPTECQRETIRREAPTSNIVPFCSSLYLCSEWKQ